MREVSEGAEHTRSNVGRLERIHVPAAEGKVLDPRPVKRRAFFPEHREHRVSRIHHEAESGPITRSANRSRSSGFGKANGCTQGETISSSTPSASNALVLSIT